MTATATPEFPKHLPVLDGFRALSILAVLASHMLPLGPSSWHLNLTFGYMGMSIFFALSGFLISRFLWEKQDIPTFFVRRVARIAPLVLLVTFIYCILLEGRFDAFVIINLYLQNYLVDALLPSVSPLWSLAVEMHFYIAIGLAIWVFGRRGFWLLPLGYLCVMALRIEGGVFGNINTHLRVDEILTGGLLALAWLNRDRPAIARAFAMLPALFYPLLVLWALSCWPDVLLLGYGRSALSALLIGSVLMMKGGWQTRFLGTVTMRYVATISFALYVWHSPFRAFWFDTGTDIERYLMKRPLAFACIWALAHLSTFYFEKPILKAARNIKFGGRTASRQTDQ